MKIKATALLVLLMPGLTLLAACNRTPAPAVDDAATPPTADAMPAEAAPVDSMAADQMAADKMAADKMAADNMAAMPGMKGDEMSFADMDKNHDGSITHDEMSDADMLHQHFSVADSNGDGKLSEAEVTKHRADMAAAPAK